MSRVVSARTLERASALRVFARGSASGRGAGERVSGSVGRGTTFKEHRTYVAGDDLRYVDWNAYGRLRSLHVKVFELEENLDLHLLVDRSASMGSGPGSKLETALRVAALVGAAALAGGDAVRLQFLPPVDGAEVPRAEPAFRGRGATAGLVDALGSAAPGAREPLGLALRRVFPRLRRRGFALLVTDFLDQPHGGQSCAEPSSADPGGRARQDRGWQYAIDFLAHRRVSLTAIHVIAPQERDPSLGGPLRLSDAESGMAIELDVDDELLAEYRRRFRRRVRAVRGYLAGKEARHVIADTGRGDEAQLLRLLLREGVLA